MSTVLVNSVQSGPSGKTDRKHAGPCIIACIGSFIPSNNIADSRREGEMGAICHPLPLKTPSKPITKQSGLINTCTVIQVYFGIQSGPDG
jgi:hypothetical protein